MPLLPPRKRLNAQRKQPARPGRRRAKRTKATSMIPKRTTALKREAVLIALHSDGFIEAFGEKNVDVRIASVPHCPSSEILAEDAFELLLPHRYRRLFWPVKIRATAMHRPLLSSTMARSIVVRDCITSLNDILQKHQPEQELTVWTL